MERADISGSGIGTIIGFPGVEPGDVSLIAPLGTINAGEAGIRVSGNLNLAALYVLNANNFQVSGEVKGLPTQENAISAIKLESTESSQKAATDAVKDVTQSRASGSLPSSSSKCSASGAVAATRRATRTNRAGVMRPMSNGRRIWVAPIRLRALARVVALLDGDAFGTLAPRSRAKIPCWTH